MPIDTVGATPRTPAQHDRRTRIVEAATALLEENDYDRIMVREVAERADVALDTLYRYFPSKEHLYVHVLVEWSSGFERRTRQPSESHTLSDSDRLAAALRRTVRAYERRPTFYRLITVLEAATDPTVAASYGGFTDRFQGALRDVFHDTADHDARVISLAARAMMGSLLSSWAHGQTPLAEVYADLERFVDLVYPVSRRGQAAASSIR